MTTNSIWTLSKPSPSIFHGLTCKEYPDFDKICGFIENGDGIMLTSDYHQYTNESEMYIKYLANISKKIIKNVKRNVEVKYFNTDGYGRICAMDGLTLSIFHRPSRHTFAESNYIDFDMVNCQVQLFIELANKHNAKSSNHICVDYLRAYCENPKKIRQEIIDYYGLNDRLDRNGALILAKDVAKRLAFVMCFGGGFNRWREKNDIKIDKPDFDFMVHFQTEISNIRDIIFSRNPELHAYLLDKKEKYKKSNDDGKRRSLMAEFAQTWERLMQETAIFTITKRCKNVRLQDIIPSQDGFMVLKSQVEDVELSELTKLFTEQIYEKFEISIKWEVKPFDERIINSPESSVFPIHIGLNDLIQGECHICECIIPAVSNWFYFDNRISKYWVCDEDTNIWRVTSTVPQKRVVKLIQNSISREISILYKKKSKETDDKKKEILQTEIDALTKHSRVVSGGGYITQLSKYLKEELVFDNFQSILDKTVGKYVFSDGIYDLKTGKFVAGFKPEDFISFTLSIRYEDVMKYSPEKEAELKTKYFKKTFNNNETHMEYILSVFGSSLTGDASKDKSIYFIMDGTEERKGDNGKTLMFSLCSAVFPEYIKLSNPTVLLEKNEKAHKQIVEFKNKRIIHLDEFPKDKKINSELFKKLADGIQLENEVMYGTTELIDINFKLFICSNHEMPLKEEACYNRYKKIELCSHFDRSGKTKEDDPEKLKFVAEMGLLENLTTNYRNEIAHLLLTYSEKFYKKGLPTIPEAFVKAVEKTRNENNEFLQWFNARFETGTDLKISKGDLETYTYKGYNLMHKNNRKELDALGFKYEKNISFGYDKHTKKQIKGGYIGFTSLDSNEDDESVDETKTEGI